MRGRRRSVIAWVRRHPLVCLAVYGALLLANWFALGEGNAARRAWGEAYMQGVGATRMTLDRPGLPVRDAPIEFWVATRGDIRDASRPPALLLHGSPGGASGFTSSFGRPGLVEALTDQRRAVIWLDLPGFAAQIDPERRFTRYSADAYADVVLGVLDALGVERAHVVGWSNGGAVGLHMAEEERGRLASLTLLASVGVQETEGSGSYVFEHAKYGVGQAVLNVGGLLVPQFGLFGPAAETRAFLANFQETDQRRLRPIMASLDTPTLILHGRHDFLTPAWGAELHHRVIPTSRLVMLDASHFIPFLEAEEAAAVMGTFFERHDLPGVAPITTYEDRAPEPDRAGVARAIEWLGEQVRWTPWWALAAGLALLARWRPELATVLAGMYVGRADLDIGVAVLGLFIGRVTRPATPFDGRRLPLGWLGTLAWTGVSVGVVFLLEQDTFPWHFGPDDAALRFGAPGFVLHAALLALALHAARNLGRRRGRQRLRAQWTRLVRHEYWPSWAIYLPVLPIWLGRLFRPGGVLAFTAANPGIPAGGGITGESKSHILRAMDDPRVLAHERIAAGPPPAARADRALAAIEGRPELGGFPVILKPDSGERGADVKLARAPADVHAYFEGVREDAVVQRFAPGPAEFGVLWVRRPACVARESAPGEPAGAVFAVTDKRFPEVVGDGRRTLGELILAHPRGRAQAGVLFARFGARTRAVVPEGERVRFSNAGNHAQGCAFYDGMGLVTPELERAIDAVARSFRGGLDFGRFDVRCPSPGHFSRAEELSIIEVNGVTSEATSLYDPTRSPLFAWGLLRRQWRALYAVAEARLAAGGRAVSWRAFLAAVRSQRRATGTTD